MCQYMRVPFDWLPASGGIVAGLRAYRRVRQLTSGKLPLTYPPRDELDEYPLVPFLFGDDGSNIYDSTAIAQWLDDHHGTPTRRLIPSHPACAFVARLIDEHFDEFGLYVAHHNRWTASALDNDAGTRVAAEFGRVLPGFAQRKAGDGFARRQVRRLPYLFSVASDGYAVPGLPKSLTPPSREGFPPTHALLDDAFKRSLDLLEPILLERPFLFGSRFTLADASVYGELGMNTHDPSAEQIIEQRAPATRRWLETLHDGGAVDFADGHEPSPDDIAALTPLLQEIVQIFVPLMEQNEAAYERYRKEGQTHFNEAAFDRGEALYDGELFGHPFRSVAKSFQVKAWRQVKAAYSALDSHARQALPSAVRRAFEPPVAAGAAPPPAR